MLSSSKQRRSILSVVESNGQSNSNKRFSSAQVAVLGILVVGAVLAGSSYRLTHRISSRGTSESQLLPSRDGLMSVTRCPERLKTCETRIHKCGEQALGCEDLLQQCRSIARACRHAMEATKADLPEGWVTQLQEDWDTRFKGHGLGHRPKNPYGNCGKHGYMGADGKCRCAIMYAGSDCQHGFTLLWSLHTHFDKTFGLTPQKRKFDGEYWGSVILSQESRMGGQSGGRQNWHGQDMKLKLHYRDLKTGKEKKDVRNLGRADQHLFKVLPEYDEVGNKVYDQCAVVGSSGVLLNLKQGKEIDRHDMVLRFNGAPVKGFEPHVGSKTTMRLVTTPFLAYNEAGETVLHSPRTEKVMAAYRARRKHTELSEKAPLHLLDPEFGSWVQNVVLEWKPTIAWTGIMLAMQICRRVDLYGLFVTESAGSPYHYHDTCTNPSSLRQREEADMREWTLLRSLEQTGLVHFMEPCVVECRVHPDLCHACRQRAPGWSDTISPEMAELRASRKRLSSNHCKKADLHHAVEEATEEEEEGAAGQGEPQQGSGGAAEEEPERRFDPLLG